VGIPFRKKSKKKTLVIDSLRADFDLAGGQLKFLRVIFSLENTRLKQCAFGE
jgi:hypothetical protein